MFPRSIVATATFFLTGVITTHALYRHSLEVPSNMDWSLKPNTASQLTSYLAPLVFSAMLYFLVRIQPFFPFAGAPLLNGIQSQTPNEQQSEEPKSTRRHLVNLATSFSFAVALSYSNLTVASKVSSFLVLPFHKAFDPSLLYVAISTLPISASLYHFGRIGGEKSLLGGKWCVPTNRKIDAKLVLGAALFGVGWGMTGICRACPITFPLIGDSDVVGTDNCDAAGPGVVNAGRAWATGAETSQAIAWLGSLVVGGFLADLW